MVRLPRQANHPAMISISALSLKQCGKSYLVRRLEIVLKPLSLWNNDITEDIKHCTVSSYNNVSPEGASPKTTVMLSAISHITQGGNGGLLTSLEAERQLPLGQLWNDWR
jgi:hypothetical protein